MLLSVTWGPLPFVDGGSGMQNSLLACTNVSLILVRSTTSCFSSAFQTHAPLGFDG